MTPPISPIHIHVVEKLPFGMKNAPTANPSTIRYLKPQKPFWMGARPSRDDFAPTIITDISAKKQASAKQMR